MSASAETWLRDALPRAALLMAALAWILVLGAIAYASLFGSDAEGTIVVAVRAGIWLAGAAVVTSVVCAITKAQTRLSIWAFGAGAMFFAIGTVIVGVGRWFK
jgi:hypothetical protein